MGGVSAASSPAARALRLARGPFPALAVRLPEELSSSSWTSRHNSWVLGWESDPGWVPQRPRLFICTHRGQQVAPPRQVQPRLEKVNT